ncbi:MAG: cation:proton antiporter, partial [Candidatus Binatia bacterium]
MTVSAVVTVIFHLLRQPVVLGYLVAGVLIGPHTPPFSFVTDLHSIHTLAELGIVLLLFALGLEFDLKKLRKVGGSALLAGSVELLFMFWLGYSAGQLFGWRQMDSLFLGALVAISSTTIIVQVLLETGQLREQFAQVILGILVIEDIAAIVILVVLSGLAQAGAITALDIGWAFLRVGMFMATTLLVGIFFVPRLITFVTKSQRSEMLTIAVLGLAFGLAVLGVQMGFSVALGAFLMGAIMAEAKEAHIIVERIEPIREMFTAVFFVATGMMLEPALVAQLWQSILVVAGIVVGGKILGCSLGAFVAGYPGQVALSVGLGMAQIGEFSFIIANLGRSSGVTDATLFPIAVAVSSLTTFLTPYLLRSAATVPDVLTYYSPRPLVTFATFYTSWVARLTTRAPRSERELRSLVFRLVLYVVVAVSLFLVTWSGVHPLVRMIPAVFPGQDIVLQWGIASAVALPFLFLISQVLERLIGQMASSLLRRETSAAAGQTQLVRNTLYFLFGWIVGIFVLAACTPVLPSWMPLITVGIGLFILSYIFWESLSRFHGQIDRILHTLGDDPVPTDAASTPKSQDLRQEMTQLLSERYGLTVQTEDFVMPFMPTALNQPIGALNVRTLTGASIVAIYRDPEQVVIPQADTVLLPSDVLVLLGERDQLAAALKLLTELAARKPTAVSVAPKIDTVAVCDGSPFVARSLRELGIRENLGVLVVGVERDAERITNPGPDFSVQSGDVLYVWGAPEQIENLRGRASGVNH